MSDTKVLVLKSTLMLNSTLPQQRYADYSNMYFDVNENNVIVPIVDWIDRASFEEELDSLRVFIRQNKNKIKGEILVYVKDSDVTYQGRYKVTTAKFTFDQCELSVMVKKKQKEKQKTLTEEEKLDLFRDYWEKKREIPGKNEVYNGFRIGVFYTNMMKNQNTIQLLNQIMETETPP